jgi:L-alanine-DL-glutamate epimerase-like enolase superfamily enzyme
MARLGCFAFGGRLSPGQAVRLDVDSTDAYDEVLTNPIPIDDGYASVPAGPGWGTDIDDEVLKKYPPSELVPVESEPYLDFF